VSDARRAVLAAIRAAGAPTVALPPDPPVAAAPPPGALRDAFARALGAAGGALLDAADGRPLDAVLASLPVYRSARRIVSALPGLEGPALEAAGPGDSRALEGVDLALVPGAFGVAENGAVWVDAGALPERALLWLAEHLVLVVPVGALVADLHAAYERLRFEGPGFGVFVAGPSKTADIEQALVIGAQGPRSTTVVLR
jgi:L-lactate dehydrogenase complex protein LldG